MIPFDKTRYADLLKGLEISEVLLSALERTKRIDAEFYAKAHLETEKILRANNAVSLCKFASVSDGNHLGVSDDFCAEGVLYFRGGDIKEFFLSFVKPEYCVPQAVFDMPIMRRSQMKKGDVFVSIVGAIIGQIGMKTDDTPALCSCKLGILRPYEMKTSAYLAAFLLSSMGQSQIWRFRRGSAQTGLILDDIDQLVAPEYSDEFYKKIAEIIQAALDARCGAVSRIQSAEQLLLAKIGFADWLPIEDTISVRRYPEVVLTGRFDAEYFQPKYDEIVKKLKSYKNGTITAKTALVTGLVKDSDGAQEHYVELANIGPRGEIEGCMVACWDALPSRARQRIQTGQVIASSIEGSLDRCALVTDEYDNALCSTGFHRFQSKLINPETLLLLFKSWPIQQLMKRGCSGTILSAILPDELAHVVLPLIEPHLQKDLAAKVQESFALRRESKHLLELAKRTVELAIEQGENAALKILKQKGIYAN